MTDVPTPGSREASEQGCTCPVLDNNHGAGFPWGGEGMSFWITEGCPLHYKPKEYVESPQAED